MAGLFDVVNRRRRSRELADKFREGATPEELEYFDRFYQEPSSSPVMARGALEGELDAAGALQRQLMARGMNNLQAQDRVSREGVERDAEFGRSRELYQQAHPNEGVAASSPLSYQRYTEDYAPYTQTDDQGVESAMTGDPMSEQDFLNKQIARQRLAGDTSAAADAQYKSETVDDRISMLQEQAKVLPSELASKGASAELNTAYMRELNKHLGIASAYPPDSPEHQNALNAAEELHRLVKGTSGGGGFSSYGAGDFIKSVEEGVQKSQASGDTVVEQDGQQLIVPRQPHLVGEYQK
jgi:hypothetical protein